MTVSGPISASPDKIAILSKFADKNCPNEEYGVETSDTHCTSVRHMERMSEKLPHSSIPDQISSSPPDLSGFPSLKSAVIFLQGGRKRERRREREERERERGREREESLVPTFRLPECCLAI